MYDKITSFMQLKYPDTSLIALLAAAYGILGAALWEWIGPGATVPLLVVLLVLIAGLQLHLFRVREMQDVHQLRQIQALFSLYKLIPFEAAPPLLTGWAATPEFALTLYELVRDRRPDRIVELGSGASSIVMAAALRENGNGHLICVDQDPDYTERTRRELARQGLGAAVEVIHAPIVRTSIDGKSRLWYDREAIPSDGEIDLLVIDGPHRELQREARYPALPVFFARLADDAVIVLDDAHRRDEKASVNKWMETFSGLTVEYRDSPKGTAILRRVRK